MNPARLFFLSPANCAGRRAQMLLKGTAQFELARRLHRGESVSLGEICAFLSSLYFRGKLAYVRKFAPGRAWVITSHRGLVPVETLVDLEELHALAAVPIDLAEPRYTEPLRETARALQEEHGACEAVLLGSIATGKYVDCLLPVFGEALHFPAEFVGRGDMSRGGLMLRCAEAGTELAYISVAQAVRRGKRPPKLEQRKPITPP
jgi:hypothetical protein